MWCERFFARIMLRKKNFRRRKFIKVPGRSIHKPPGAQSTPGGLCWDDCTGFALQFIPVLHVAMGAILKLILFSRFSALPAVNSSG